MTLQPEGIAILQGSWCNCGAKCRGLTDYGSTATLIESGGGTGPVKLRQPRERKLRARCQLPRRVLREMRRIIAAKPLSSANLDNYRNGEGS